MSEETALALKEAEANYSALEKEIDAYKEEFLAAVAVHVPRKVTEFAKKTALSEPEVTKALGAEGVKAMRGELESLAEQLAKDVAGGAFAIEWPTPSLYSAAKFNDLHSALFRYMRPKVDKIAGVFKRNGYNVYDNNAQRSQGLVLPQWFYSEGDLTEQTTPLLKGLSRLAKAELAVEKAKKAHDDSTVGDLWGD